MRRLPPPEAVKASWPYADANYVEAKVSYESKDVLLPVKPERYNRATPWAAPICPDKILERMRLVPPAHLDKRFDIGVPHDKPDVVHTFVVKNFKNTSPRIPRTRE